ncbi:recombinase family protein [Enterobacter roggenkampii]|uniref:recombinase family protein n=1 Tax=Enterobacter roggenkampii TaxID=1812935 RepID=UPI002FCE01C5
MLIGYVRVSTNDKNTALQRDALERSGCELIFEDKMSGKTAERPGLKKLLKRLYPVNRRDCLMAQDYHHGVRVVEINEGSARGC